MTASAVKDLLSEPRTKGVWGVTARPEESAWPVP